MMNFNQQAILLSVGNPYQFQTEDGKQMSGCKIHYIATRDMDKPVVTENCLGHAPLTETMPYEFYERAKQVGVPAAVNLTLAQRTEKGKQVLKVVGLEFEDVDEQPKAAKK